MNIKSWYQKRGIKFILERAKKLNERYSFSPKKSIDRISGCMKALQEYGFHPTFAVPGRVVERNLPFILQLQSEGAEIAVHGYNHVDLKAFEPHEATSQLKYAADMFRANGLEVHGFRCPYLSATDDLIDAIPHGMFEYSSNKAIQWPFDAPEDMIESLMFETIKGFYLPNKAESSLCLPWFQNGLVEIPVCVPDDLQLHDGLGYGLEQISKVWINILHQTHQRGEVFNLMFHPELASFCEAPFLKVLQEARTLQPEVWFTRLRDIGAWWVEKSAFRVEVEAIEDDYTLNFHCSPRATILCRGFEPKAQASDWNGGYWRLETQTISIDSPKLPFLGLLGYAPDWVISTLSAMGYILETGETAHQCDLCIDESQLANLSNPVDLIAYIERQNGQLIRFWPWPDGKRSALCINGDLDALSLVDYALRLLKK